MGCGASTHAQGTKPPAVAEPRRSTQQDISAQVPVAEDVRAVPDQQPKRGGKDAAGAGDEGVSGPAQTPEVRVTAAAPGDDKPQADGYENGLDQGDGGGGVGGLPRAGSLLRSNDGPSDAGRLVLADKSRPSGDADGPTPGTPSMDPAVTPSSATATVTLGLGTGGGSGDGEAAHGFNPRSRYTNQSDLSMASTSYDVSGRGGDSDSEDELEALFTLASWKRYYGYNKKKHQDLLTYFWRKFPPAEFSLYCVSYRHADLLLTPYMADNLVAGYMCRIDELGLGEAVFAQMYSLHDFEVDRYKVVGLVLVQGTALPTQLAALSAFDGFAYLRADTSVTLVKHFVSALLVGKSPLNSLSLISGRELT